ncbi:AraC family transcriptional regulator [Longitalea arenae]|uniref:AraC family transcriptional regulator n=1 Tax=Longitalea arenae TaxID=2812558 RepID=UPI001966F4C2|nr:AraC family transcriptional regulator [Longitalea arenae]
MKSTSKRLPLSLNTSFSSHIVRTPLFQTGWHQHIEYELILFIQGSGKVCIGDYEGHYQAGDIYFIGSNLPHAFKTAINTAVSALTIQFRENFLGSHFMNVPECKTIKELLKKATGGVQITEKAKTNLSLLMHALEKKKGITRIILLLQCFEIMSLNDNYNILAAKKAQRPIDRNVDSIDKVIDFTLVSFHDRISLSLVATLACMSIPSFCHHFKQSTGKSYIDFLNQVRIENACNQLLKTDKPVINICYESGYNTVAYFHRQFLRIKKITPLKYRKSTLVV